MSDTQIPAGLSYTPSHEWVRIDAGDATIGITDYAQSELGDIVFVETPAVGAGVRADEAFGTIEAVKTVADLIAPASGKVVATNAALVDHPELVNTDPYGAGWLIRVHLDDPGDLARLLDPGGYRQLLDAQ